MLLSVSDAPSASPPDGPWKGRTSRTKYEKIQARKSASCCVPYSHLDDVQEILRPCQRGLASLVLLF